MGSCPAQPAQRSHAAPGGWGGSGGSQPELPRPSPPPRADGHGCTPSHSGVCGGGGPGHSEGARRSASGGAQPSGCRILVSTPSFFALAALEFTLSQAWKEKSTCA